MRSPIRWRSFSYAVLAIAALLCTPLVCAAQSVPGDTVYQMHGVVLNGVTGKPVARALVQSADRRLATMSDAEGKFAFEVSVPPSQQPAMQNGMQRRLNRFGGGLMLMAMKPGFVANNDLKFVPIDETLNTTNVELKLMPAAVITGRVTAGGADSPQGVRVMLFARQVNGGDLTWVQNSMQVTDGRGEFRFSNLQPGDYTLMTTEWRGDQVLPEGLVNNVTAQRYPQTVLGDAQDVASGTRLHLRSGESAVAEFYLHPATYYPVTVMLAERPMNSNVNARLAGKDIFNGSGFRYNSREGALQGMLPSGTYTLQLSGGGDPRTFASVPLHVDGGSVRIGPVVLMPAASITVHVHTQFTNTKNSQQMAMMSGGPLNSGRNGAQNIVSYMNLFLRSDDNSFGANARPLPDGDLVFENLQPGRYRVTPQPYRGYVSSMSQGSLDLMKEPLIVTAGGASNPIDVALRDDTATLNGTVKMDGESQPTQTYILLLPTDDSARFTQSFANPEGKFFVSNLAPGGYRILAFHSPRQQIAFHDEETMRKYEGKGVTITLSPGQTAQAEVPSIEDDEATP